MDAAVDRVAILVAGMHRSGTSALTRVLGHLGCDLPRTLMPANEFNPAGYWESERISAFNEELLASAGSTWDDWEPFNADWRASPVAGEFRGRACKVLAEEFGDSRLFVLKDPRACRLLDFWIDALAAFGADARVVLPVRNPLEVAASLQDRDVLEPPVGLLLWLRHVLDAEHASRHRPRAFVRFEDLLRNWHPLAETLARDLHVSWPRRSTAAALEIEAELTPSGRHQVRDDAAVANSPEVSRWVESTFEIMQRWTQGDVCEADVAALDATRAAFDEAGPSFARAVVSGVRAVQHNRGLEREVANLQTAVADRERQIDSLNRAVADRDENVEYLDGVVRAKDRELDAMGATMTERDRQIDALNHVVAGRDGEIGGLKGDVEGLREVVAERDAQIGAMQEAVKDRDGQIDALHDVIEHRDEELSGVYASRSWGITKPLRAGNQALRDMRHVAVRGVRFVARATLGLGWRLLPLPASKRAAIRERAARAFPILRPLSRENSRPEPGRTYVHSGWLDLADRNYEARADGAGLPILFDPDWYLATYPDLRDADIDPLQHYLDHGAAEGRWPVDLDPAEVDPTIQALHRLDPASEEADAFDAAFCRVLHPELAGLSDAELALVCGPDGERIGSKAAFVAEICDNPREIPLDFNAAEYIRLYPDLRWLADQSPLEALRHYMRHGRFEPRLHTLRTDPAEAAGVSTDGAQASDPRHAERPLCVLAHVYYPELWEELAGYLGNLPADRFDLYVNLVDDTFDPALLARIRGEFPAARIYISENVGRDIGGHFHVLRNLRISDYALFCLVHTKKSPHMAEGEVQRWRRKLLEPLLGTRACAAENLRTMLDDEGIGLLGSARCRYTEMNANEEKYGQLLERMGIAGDSAEVEFLSGTMMFLRADVLERVFETAHDQAFERSDAKIVEGDPDGAWAHAVERVFGAVVRDMGYRFEWR